MSRVIEIDHLKIGGRNQPRFIAEIGINHNGDIPTLYDLAHQCIDAGADIIKTQYHLPAFEMANGHPWYELMNECLLTLGQLESLKEMVEGEGAVFLCTPFCPEAADGLEFIGVSAFKTGSGECNNLPFLLHVASFGKPMIVSTGMTTREELIASMDAVRAVNRDVVLMNCTSNYPSTPEETRLRRIDWLMSMFSLPTGQSDHSPSIATGLGAIARGACLVEKHVTLDKSAAGPDHAVSLTPDEFGQMVNLGVEIWSGMQRCTEFDYCRLVKGEQELRDIANQSLVATAPIKKGEQFTEANVSYMRPGTGIPASRICEVLGTTAPKAIKKGALLPTDMLY